MNDYSEYTMRGAHHDQKALDGVHLFERAGMGAAPFRLLSFGKSPGCCEYCGTSCTYRGVICSSDGQESRVGSDCVMKVGDAGLLSRIKRSPEYRAIQRQKRYSLDERKQEEIRQILTRLPEPVRIGYECRLKWCGMAGRARVLKDLRLEAARLAVTP